jgi:glycosyltransferase involved in cell wall biosynthesis
MPDPIRVVLVVGPTTGGIGRHVHALGGALVGRGHIVTVVAPPGTEELFGWSGLGMRFVAAPVGALTPSGVSAALRAVRAVAVGADVVHAHGARAGAVAALAKVHPLAVTWHNTRPARMGRRLWHPLVERLAARGADLTLVVSPDLVARAGRAGAEDIRLVAVPAPPLAAPSRDRDQVRAELGVGDRPLVLALARLERQKRLDLLVEATARWVDRPDRPVVVVAGSGSQAQALQRRASAVGSPLLLLGRRDDVADLLAAADLAVLPSDWEGYPLVAQEALRTGVPLVATSVGGVPALVGSAAVLVPPDSPAELRGRLEELLGDPERRASLAAAGVERAGQWPTLEATVDDIEQVYRTLKSR